MFAFTDTKAICDEGAWVHLKDNGVKAYLDGDKEKPIRVKLLGPDSPKLQEKLRKIAAKEMKARAGDVALAKMSVPQIEEFLKERSGTDAVHFAAATVAWENMPEGADFSEEAALELYVKYPAIIRQLFEEAGSIADFLELASKS